nr:phage portal protein [Bacillaceae bacterium]
MGLRDILFWFKNDTNSYDLKATIFDLGIEVYYKKLAVNACVNLIANMLVKSEFRTFEKGKEKKGSNHYLFNVQPNQNQNSSEFIHELVSKLVYENECLVVMQNDQLYVADEFEKTPYAFKENVYKNVTVNDYKLDKTFYESEVFYFKLNNERIAGVIDNLYMSYGKLITSSMNYYKRSNAMRATLKMNTSRSQTDEAQAAIEDLFNNQLKSFFNSEGGAVLPLQDGIELNVLEKFSTSGQTSRDVRALVDDIFDFVSIAFHIPKGLLKGDIAEIEAQTDNFIMFCISPIAELLEDEFNRKLYSKQEYLERTYLKVDTRLIKYVDIVKLANALDKFLASGTHSANENRMLIGAEPVEEEWAYKHHITKNYEDAETRLKGGGKE